MGRVSGGGNIPIQSHDEMQPGQTTAVAIAEPPVSPKLGDFNLIYSFLGCRGGRSLGGFVHHDSASPQSCSPQRPDTTTKPSHDEFIRVNDGGTTNCIGGAPGGNDMAPTHTEPGLSTASAELEDFKGDRILRVQAKPSPERPLILGDLPIANSLNHLFWKLERERRIDKRVINRLYPDLELTTHVFIDMSNIYIGFNDTFKFLRGIPDCDRTPLPPINFEALSRVLERDRMIGVKELVGSAADPDNLTDLPNYFGDARKLGYKTSILRRVLKPKRMYRRPLPRVTPPPTGFSSSESGEFYGIAGRKMSYREQGVDEILQLKMANTVMEFLGEPGIMVLATGDAEKAEYSDGFQKQAERILSVGWLIEVVSWRKGLSQAWRRQSWTQKWGKQFRIILLDDYIDDVQDA